MPVAELLIEEIKTLPEKYVAEVLDFVGYIKEKAARDAKQNLQTDDSWIERGEECPICATHRDPVTGEERFNAETAAAIREGRAMLRGEIPAKWYNSPDEMWEDLMKDDPED